MHRILLISEQVENPDLSGD